MSGEENDDKSCDIPNLIERDDKSSDGEISSINKENFDQHITKNINIINQNFENQKQYKIILPINFEQSNSNHIFANEKKNYYVSKPNTDEAAGDSNNNSTALRQHCKIHQRP